MEWLLLFAIVGWLLALSGWGSFLYTLKQLKRLEDGIVDAHEQRREREMPRKLTGGG